MGGHLRAKVVDMKGMTQGMLVSVVGTGLITGCPEPGSLATPRVTLTVMVGELTYRRGLIFGGLATYDSGVT
jgi:hypothetical protein